MKFIAIAGALDLLLVVLHSLLPTIPHIPLAGTEISQLGVLLGAALGVSELVRIVRSMKWSENE